MIRSLVVAAALVAVLVHPAAAEKYLLIQLKSGTVKIEFLPEVAPEHVKRITTLAKDGAYDGVAFHRVMAGFMAQTGDVKYGKIKNDGTVDRRAGTGDSNLPDLKAEFNDTPFVRGVAGMARQGDPYVNTGNSQFFIVLEDSTFLDRNYTAWGKVVDGMEHVDNIKLGAKKTGKVTGPDHMIKVTVSDE